VNHSNQFKVFVAGHRGMVGSAILRTAPLGTKIFTTTRDELDLTDKDAVESYLKKTAPDAVIIAAARVGGIGANSSHQRQFLIENLSLQNSIISASADANISKLIFLGSSCIYPKNASQPIKESSLLTGILEPTNEGYALAKIAGVRLAKAIYDEEQLDFFSLMPTNLYGPGDNFSLESSHVPAALMRKFHEAKINGFGSVTVWGTGTPRREFMHVDDLARACWYMLNLKVGGELLNVGTGEDIEISKFASLMAKVVGFEGDIVYDASKPDGTARKLLDVTKIRGYGWQHLVELEDGLKQTYSWFVNSLESGSVRGI
jgi:GDP-L-fucose synthase